MICLADNDLLIQLGAWDLLGEFQAFLQKRFGVLPADIYILDGFVRRLQKENSPWERQYGKAALERVARFCSGVSRVYNLPHDAGVIATLSSDDIDNIDEGEAVLIAVAIHNPESFILTNEWRFLAGLSHPDCTQYHLALQGRVLHLRQIIYLFFQEKNFSFMKPKISQAQKSDALIYRAFQGTASQAQHTLKGAVEEVERIARGMLVTMEEP